MDKQSIERFEVTIALMCTTLLLALFVMTLIGVIDIRITEQVTLSPIVEFIGSCIFLQINAIFFVSITCDFNYKKSFAYSLIFIIVAIFLSLFEIFKGFFISFVLPIIFVIICMSKSDISKKSVIKRLCLLSFLCVTYEYLSGFIKLYLFNLQFQRVNFLTLSLYSIDLFLFYIICKKGVSIYGRLVDSRKFLFPSKSKCIRRNEKNCKNVLEFEDLTQKQRVIFASMAIGYQIFQLLIVLAIGHINQMFVELLIMLPVFWINRKILGKSWHSDKLWICSMVTFSSFYILTKITPPLEVSIFLVVILSGVFVYILHILGVKEDRLNCLEKNNIKLEKKLEIFSGEFSRYGFSRRMESFAIDWLTNGMTDKELMIKHEIDSKSTLDSRKRRIKAKMNTI